jgi:hypothetical protein
MNTGMAVVYKEQELEAGKALDLFINGWYFHNDGAKRQLLKSLLPHEEGIFKLHFLLVVIGVSEIVYYTRGVIQDAMAKKLVTGQR